jgi:pre-60S factor REI1
MSLKFGFFIPDREYLTDLDGLLTYLSEKVKLGGLCLFCQKQFTPGKPCMDHMVSKSHCKIRYEDGVDLDEFEDFYDFSACYEDADSDDGNEDVIQIDAAGDLILPSGLKAGHRMRRIYYKQWFKPEETRESVLAQRREELVRLYGQLGRPFRESAIMSRLSDAEVMNMLHQQQRQVRKLKFIEERAQRKHEFRSIKTREYQSTTDRLRSSATTTDKIRDYHSILV